LLQGLRGEASGQLLSYDPVTHQVKEVLENIAYANGVAISADGSFVAVVETNTCRVLRRWLKGPKKGSTDTLIDRLPGFPDGISLSSDGGFWLSLVTPLSPVMKWLGPYRLLRQVFSHAVHSLLPFVAKKRGCIVKLSPSGQPLETLLDADGSHISTVSAVTEHKGMLFLGNLGGDFISVVKL